MKPWWNANGVQRLLIDLTAAELARLQPGMRRFAPLPEISDSRQINLALSQDIAALELDSLEYLDLVTAVVVQFHLHETGLEDRLFRQRHLADWVGTVLDSRAIWDDAISFQTSGSTAQPKLCTHQMRLLEEEIAFFAGQLHDRQRVLSAVPAHHIYGFLFSVMLPAWLEINVLDVRDALPVTVLRQAQPGDLIIGHPTFFDLATRAPLSVASDVMAVSSTVHCPESIWERLGASGITRLIEVYGASETAGIGVREMHDDPLQLLPCWSRDAGSDERILRVSPGGVPLAVVLPDHVRWLDADRFQVTRRRDGAVQVGGVNVFPGRVQECLCQHPDVTAALVRLGDSGRLKAFVVPDPMCQDPEQLTERLHHWLAGRLSAPEQPRAITVGAQLPHSALGKLADWD